MAKQNMKGLYKPAESTLWWLRTVRSPLSGVVVRRSTGTDDPTRAIHIRDKVKELTRQRANWDLLEKVVRDDLSLAELYDFTSLGNFHVLRSQPVNGAAPVTASPLVASPVMVPTTPAADPLLAPLVDEWAEYIKSAPTRRGGTISERTRNEYVRYVREITEGLTASQFTEDTVRVRVHARKGTRGDESADAASSTKRIVFVAVEKFYRFARKKITLANPFEDTRDWKPIAKAPRSTHWEFTRVQDVLAHMRGVEKLAMSVVFGSGIEESALLAQTGADVNWRNKRERTMVAQGTKNGHRETRTIFVDKWAWKALVKHAKLVLPRAKLWPWATAKPLREAFYRAQVAANLIAEPPKSLNAKGKWNGKYKWGAVKPHTVHDARHSFVFNRLLGLDGEPRQSLKYCANNLGHADEQMGMKVYSKANVAERLRMLELAEARGKQRRRA